MMRKRSFGSLAKQAIKAGIRDAERKQRLERLPHAKRERKLLSQHRDKYIDALLVIDGKGCHWCGKPLVARCHVDHVLPVALGGLTQKDNVALSCPDCNLAKSDTHPKDWRRSPCCDRHAWAWPSSRRAA